MHKLRRFAYGLAATLLAILVLQRAGQAQTAPGWANPSAMSVRLVGPAGDSPSQPNFLSNLDCSPLTYRLVAEATMRSGCFSEAAFGLVDTDSDTVIFTGTDEGLGLLPYSSGTVLVPWPGTLDVLALDALPTGGSSLHLYKNVLSLLKDQRNALGQLTAKQLTTAPEVTLLGPDGQPLVVNAQTLAFSSGGSWLVAETLRGSFVRFNLASLQSLSFAPSFGSQGSPALLKSQDAVSGSGRFVAIHNAAAGSFKVNGLEGCPGSPCPDYDYLPFLRSQIPGLQTVQQLRFINENLLSFVAYTSSGAERYELAPADHITSLIDYLGLGDSYTSGEGAFDYLAGTDTDANMCHLSANSYPLLLARDYFGSAGGHSVACSGAMIKDIGDLGGNYRGQASDGYSYDELQTKHTEQLANILANYTPGYLAQRRFVSQYQPRVVTVSVGGDDIGFGSLLQTCVEPLLSLHPSDDTCFNTYEDRQELVQLIDRTESRWANLFRQLSQSSPDSQLYVVGYPLIADDRGSCGLNVHLSKSELEFSDELIAYLNQSIQHAAAAARVPYVDISQALVGHRLCEASSAAIAMNGLTAGKDAGPFGLRVFGNESYHPNALGQKLIEQAILRATNHFTAVSTTNGSAASGSLLSAPKSGRSLNRVNFASGTVATAGGSLQLRLSVPELASHTVTVRHRSGC